MMCHDNSKIFITVNNIAIIIIFSIRLQQGIKPWRYLKSRASELMFTLNIRMGRSVISWLWHGCWCQDGLVFSISSRIHMHHYLSSLFRLLWKTQTSRKCWIYGQKLIVEQSKENSQASWADEKDLEALITTILHPEWNRKASQHAHCETLRWKGLEQ